MLGVCCCSRAFCSCGLQGLFSSWGVQASACSGFCYRAHGLRCCTACGVFLDQEANLRPLRWQADSLPLGHYQGQPTTQLGILDYDGHFFTWGAPGSERPTSGPYLGTQYSSGFWASQERTVRKGPSFHDAVFLPAWYSLDNLQLGFDYMYHWVRGHEFEQLLGDSEGHGRKPGALRSMGSQRDGHDWAIRFKDA